MSPLDKCYVVVLAAGQGKRMGSPKALMQVGDRKWWQLQHDCLEKNGLRATWVVSQEVYDAIRGDEKCPQQMVIADSNAPMFASLLAALRSIKNETLHAVFVLPVDVPVPGISVWQSLALTKQVAVPRFHNNTGHPIHLPWGWVQSLVKRIEDDEVPIDQQRLDGLTRGIALYVDVEDESILINLNTPAELHSWLSRKSTS